MKIKTSRDLVPSLIGSAFRRVTCDSRSWFIRAIRTMRNLHCNGGRPVSTARAPARMHTGKP